jgi:hypothetical protein
MLSAGANDIIWDKMLSSGANIIMVSSGAIVIIWCYHVMLSSGMITHPFFIFPENFTHSWKSWVSVYNNKWTWENWMIYRGPCFFAVVWFGSTPTPLPPAPPSPVSSFPLFLSSFCVSPVQLTDGRGGWAWSRIVGQQGNLALYV